MRNPFTSGSSRAGMLKELLNNASLAWRLLLDPAVSPLAKLLPAAALLYVISPIDLIPDWIVGLGQLDDIAVILLAIRAFIALCPPEVVQRYRRELGLQDGSAPTSDNADANTVESSYRVLDE
ncbi:MAG: DUF1232 domain-containing protein [Chloroflexi bacterium]|nr:DUF1232 domain-containing protein [Chloroflexota bacterium]